MDIKPTSVELTKKVAENMSDTDLLQSFDSARQSLSVHNAAEGGSYYAELQARSMAQIFVRIYRKVIENRGLTPNKPDSEYLL